jgi:hypothetical protein
MTSMSSEQAHYDRLATLPYRESYFSKEDIGTLKRELLFQRAVQVYLWAVPALNMYGMKECSESTFPPPSSGR